MSTNDTPKRPRIVQSQADPADLQDDYLFFAYGPAERIEAIRKKIEERERSLFDLEMMEVMLEGNPNPGTHEPVENRQSKVGPDGVFVTRPCGCGACELVRVKDAVKGLRYALSKLRALHARMVG